MGGWGRVEGGRCYGVATANLTPTTEKGEAGGAGGGLLPRVLPLRLGQPFLVKGEWGGWFYAKRVNRWGGGVVEEGLVPKAYLHLKDSAVYSVNG